MTKIEELAAGQCYPFDSEPFMANSDLSVLSRVMGKMCLEQMKIGAREFCGKVKLVCASMVLNSTRVLVLVQEHSNHEQIKHFSNSTKA